MYSDFDQALECGFSSAIHLNLLDEELPQALINSKFLEFEEDDEPMLKCDLDMPAPINSSMELSDGMKHTFSP